MSVGRAAQDLRYSPRLQRHSSHGVRNERLYRSRAGLAELRSRVCSRDAYSEYDEEAAVGGGAVWPRQGYRGGSPSLGGGGLTRSSFHSLQASSDRLLEDSAEPEPETGLTDRIEEMVNQARQHVIQAAPLALIRDRTTSDAVLSDMQRTATDGNSRLRVDSLSDLGFTTEDLSRVFYYRLKQHDVPLFLDHLNLNQDGGLARIREIWDPKKYYWFLVVIASVAFNVYFLTAMDSSICRVYLDTFMQSHIPSKDEEDLNLQAAARKSIVTEDFTSIRDPATRDMLTHAAALVAVGEIGWLLFALLDAVRMWWVFCTDTSEYRSYRMLMLFFQKRLPTCATFSAIKLMASNHPALVYTDYMRYTQDSILRGSRVGLIAISFLYFLQQAICGIGALTAFAVKMMAVGLKLINPGYSVFFRCMNVFALMNQCMGCISMEIVLQDRLFLFTFGGQDAEYKDDEHALKNVYQSRLAKAIWSEYWLRGDRFRALVMLATFDHYDLQNLLIEETDPGYISLEPQPPPGGSLPRISSQGTLQKVEEEDDEEAEGRQMSQRQSLRVRGTSSMRSHPSHGAGVAEPESPLRRRSDRNMPRGVAADAGAPRSGSPAESDEDREPCGSLDRSTAASSGAGSVPRHGHGSGDDLEAQGARDFGSQVRDLRKSELDSELLSLASGSSTRTSGMAAMTRLLAEETQSWRDGDM